MLEPETLRTRQDDQRSFVVALVEHAPAFKRRQPFFRDQNDTHLMYMGSRGRLKVRSYLTVCMLHLPSVS
jgi:hypothetical protein